MSESTTEPITDLIAQRLLAQVGDMPQAALKPIEEIEQEQEPPKTLVPAFVKIEKNLTELGFFTPSSKRIKTTKAKTITFTKTLNGKRLEASATIVPGAIYGLPITADQDKYLALQKIINDIQRENGRVENPIGFTSADLLKVLQQRRKSGKNYQDVNDWLDVMAATTIVSEGAVYFAGQKRTVKDRFHVFDRVVSFGKEIEPGVIADRNFVWLSSWQLENINNNYQLPIDLDAYRQLKNHIAKALVPLLQIGLYASAAEGSFEKRYDELCQLLGIRKYLYLSQIRQTLGPSLDELKQHHYLSDWRIEKTSDGKGFKVVFHHGEKFHRDRRHRLRAGTETPVLTEASEPDEVEVQEPPQEPQEAPNPLLEALTSRGIGRRQAEQLLASLTQPQDVSAQLEWGDYQVQANPGKFQNPPGFYVSLIRDNVPVPDTFETSQKRQQREAEQERQKAEKEQRAHLEDTYRAYCNEQVLKHIQGMDQVDYQALLASKREALRAEHTLLADWEDAALTKLAESALSSDLAKTLPIMSFTAFCESQKRDQTPVSG